MTGQLPLPVGLRDGNTLDNFLADGNPEAVAAVESLLAGRETFVYLWGPPGTGRSHLLEGLADAAGRRGVPVVWVPLAAAGRPPVELLDGVGETAGLVCLDDIDLIAGDRRWEEAVFHLFNQLRARGASLAVSAGVPPAQLPIHLPDLRSRLAHCTRIALQPLDDAGRARLLRERAAARGLAFEDAALEWMLRRCSRDLRSLTALFERLDHASLVAQRRLTVPFLRQVLAAD